MSFTRSNGLVPPTASDVTVVVDRSGSMRSCGSSIKDGVKEMLTKHALMAKTNPHVPYHLRIVSFDKSMEVIYDGPASNLLDAYGNLNATKLTLICYWLWQCRGPTRLIQTLIDELKLQANRVETILSGFKPELRALNPRVAVSMGVLTDGQDNIGGDLKVLHALLSRHQEKYQAGCQFVASNQDAKKTGKAFGFATKLCLQMDADPEHYRSAMSSLVASTERTVSGHSAEFSGLERLGSSQTQILQSVE